jgi:hypothetical protein
MQGAFSDVAVQAAKQVIHTEVGEQHRCKSYNTKEVERDRFGHET